MTEKMFHDRLVLLQQDLENTKAQLYGMQGAIQECEYWLHVIREPVDPEIETDGTTDPESD